MRGQTERRLAALEAAAGVHDPSAGKPWHRIIQQPGQTEEEARAAYGPIGEHDNLIIRRIVTPDHAASNAHAREGMVQ